MRSVGSMGSVHCMHLLHFSLLPLGWLLPWRAMMKGLLAWKLPC